VELSSVLTRVRALLAKAESLETLGDEDSLREAKLCRERADEAMQKYGVQEWQAMQNAPKSFKPTRVKINIGDADSEFLSETSTLCNVVANFCNCSSVWMMGSGFKYNKTWGENQRKYEREEYCWVYGYESDLRYFELLFTTLYLHMSGAIAPKPDPTKTIGENAYDMRNAGLNWIEIAKAYGWREVPRWSNEPKNVYVNDNDTDLKRVGWSQAVGQYERAYRKVVKAKGESIVRIPPNGARTFRYNAAHGYLTRIAQRLREVKDRRGTGTELMLRDKSQNIRALIEESHPDMQFTGARDVKFNAEAYARGTRHANTASLNPEAGAGSTPAIG
jgi:hypothetical protein